MVLLGKMKRAIMGFYGAVGEDFKERQATFAYITFTNF